MTTLTSMRWLHISETMHQGCMLVLESGVVLVSQNATAPIDRAGVGEENSIQMRPGASTPQPSEELAGPAQGHLHGKTPQDSEPAGRDEHYERYLRERVAMQRGGAVTNVNGTGHFGSGTNGVHSNGAGPNGYAAAPGNEQSAAAVDQLLKNLGRSRDR